MNALPLLGEAPVCVYRSDWLADPARQKAFVEFAGGRGLHPPATWEELARQGKLKKAGRGTYELVEQQ